MDYSYYYQCYPKKYAPVLDGMTHYYIAYESLNEKYLNWARENIPGILLKTAFFRPLLEYLHNEGIFFANEKTKEEKL